MGSSRLPGKALIDIYDKPAIQWLIDRLRAAKRLDDIVVATTVQQTDDSLADWCADYGVQCFRGSEDDVLARVVGAHESVGSDLVVEITGDCIITDPAIVDLGIETMLVHDVDLVTNCGNHLTWPMGNYVQVFPLTKLREVADKVRDPAVREHVSLWFYENPEIYRTINILAPSDWRHPDYRFQLDYEEDLLFLRKIHEALVKDHGPAFGIAAVMNHLRDHPDLLEINIHCEERVAR